MQYLKTDGHGEPSTEPAYAQVLEALYPVVYKLKFASKREFERDHLVPPIEGLWWTDDMSMFTTARDKSQWRWMMIMAVACIDLKLFDAAVEQAGVKNSPARLWNFRIKEMNASKCVQPLHIGSYDDKGPILQEMRQGLFLSRDSS